MRLSTKKIFQALPPNFIKAVKTFDSWVPSNVYANRIGQLICLFLEEVTVLAGLEVLVQVDDNILLIVGIHKGF